MHLEGCDAMSKLKIKGKRLKLWISVLLLITLVVITMASIFKDFSITEFANILNGAQFKYIFIALVMVVLYIFFESVAFKIVMRVLKHKISWKGSFVYSSVDYFFSGITPSATGGQPFQVFYMKKDGVPIHKSTIGILLNTTFYKIVLIVLGITSAIFFPEFLEETGTIGIILFILGLLINIACIVICLMSIYCKNIIKSVGHFFLNKLGKFRIIKNIDKKILSFDKKMEDYNRSARYLNENRYVGVALFLVNLVQRLCLFSITYLVYLALVPTPTHSIYYLMALQIIVALCVDSMPFPGGTGLSELLLSTLFASVYFGESLLTSALLLTRGINFYFTLLFTGLIVLINHIRLIFKNRSRIDIHEELDDKILDKDVIKC